ncbi:MAG: GGDEF domain-containing protein [Cellulosilyticum sp.]|nr:GGDEF domain-containing protein [Cellulosilyticum sp.]
MTFALGGKRVEFIKMQIACLCFSGYLVVKYIYLKKVHTNSSRIYSVILGTCLANLILDIASIYTLRNLDIIPVWINDFMTRAFILSVNLFMGLICIYIMSLIRTNKEISNVGIKIIVGTFILSICICCTDKLYYYIDTQHVYTYGLIAQMCYICAAIYMLMSVYYLVRYWKYLSKPARETSLGCIITILLIVLIQGYYPELLISGLAGSLCTFSIFMNLENPDTFLENQFHYFNEYALVTMIQNKIIRNKKFNLVVIILENMEDIREKYGQQIERELYSAIEKRIQPLTRDGIYLYTPTVLIEVTSGKRNALESLEVLRNRFAQAWKVEGKEILIKAQVEELSLPENIDTTEQVMNCVVTLQTEFKNKKVYRDNLLEVNNRNAFERDMALIESSKYQYESLCYFTIDVNDLKKTNDQYGHLAGDKLLKACTVILIEALQHKGALYRLGGDEFGIFMTNITHKEVGEFMSRIEEIRERTNKWAQYPIRFAIGYAFFNSSRDESLQSMIKRADKMMYQNKVEMKSHR